MRVLALLGTRAGKGFCGLFLAVTSLMCQAEAQGDQWVLSEFAVSHASLGQAQSAQPSAYEGLPSSAHVSADESRLSSKVKPVGDPANNAVAAAVADGVTTSLALSAGAVETNPLISTSPLGLVAITGMKIGLVKYAEGLPKEEKRLALKTSSAAWGGAAVNNLLVLMAAPPPIPVIAGLFMGFATWFHMDSAYEDEDRILAAGEASAVAAADNSPSEFSPANNTSGN